MAIFPNKSIQEGITAVQEVSVSKCIRHQQDTEIADQITLMRLNLDLEFWDTARLNALSYAKFNPFSLHLLYPTAFILSVQDTACYTGTLIQDVALATFVHLSCTVSCLTMCSLELTVTTHRPLYRAYILLWHL